jgi:TonB-linked SusC/RagA family outer membrane protein
LKVRLSWGKNGNENIGNFRYTVLTATGNNALLGSSESMINGVKASGLANPDLKWEESEQTDFGLDFGFLNNSLTFTIDYYKKRTNGMLMEMNIPSYVGESKPIGNVGKMDNSGVEMEAAYKFRVSDVNFRIGGNLTYLKNKLIEYGNDSGWANLDSFQGIGTITRAQNGKPFPYFYGYKTDGILQNQAEADAYNNMYGTSSVPGDVRFVDVNGDGQISDDDRTDIGKGMPDWTYGFNLNVSWKNFDLSMMWQGTIGNDVFDATRRTDISSSNLPTWMLGRWTGEGTSTKYPRFVLGDNVNWQSSDLYVYDGSYLRLKNIQLGYTLPQNLTRKVFISSLRIYVAGENLLTFTKYHGYDPEISSGGTSLGIDRGVYPQARTWTIGANLSF